MKKAFLIAIVLMSTMFGNLKAQPLSYSYVIQKEGATAEQIYNALMDFIATDFLATDGDFYRDKEQFVITKDARTKFKADYQYGWYDGNIRYKIKFQCRDGRFKVEITNFYHTSQYIGNPKLKVLDAPRSAGIIMNTWKEQVLSSEVGNCPPEEILNQMINKCMAEAESMKARMERLNIEIASLDQEDW